MYVFRAPATIQDTTPLTQSCMGDFGGPIFPFLAVGGAENVSTSCCHVVKIHPVRCSKIHGTCNSPRLMDCEHFLLL